MRDGRLQQVEKEIQSTKATVVSDRSFYVKHCQAMSGNVPSSFGACFCAGCYDGLGRTVSAGKTSTGCPTSTDPMRDLLRFEDESVE